VEVFFLLLVYGQLAHFPSAPKSRPGDTHQARHGLLARWRASSPRQGSTLDPSGLHAIPKPHLVTLSLQTHPVLALPFMAQAPAPRALL